MEWNQGEAAAPGHMAYAEGQGAPSFPAPTAAASSLDLWPSLFPLQAGESVASKLAEAVEALAAAPQRELEAAVDAYEGEPHLARRCDCCVATHSRASAAGRPLPACR